MGIARPGHGLCVDPVVCCSTMVHQAGAYAMIPAMTSASEGKKRAKGLLHYSAGVRTDGFAHWPARAQQHTRLGTILQVPCLPLALRAQAL